jgi:hypothetical protein
LNSVSRGLAVMFSVDLTAFEALLILTFLALPQLLSRKAKDKKTMIKY